MAYPFSPKLHKNSHINIGYKIKITFLIKLKSNLRLKEIYNFFFLFITNKNINIKINSNILAMFVAQAAPSNPIAGNIDFPKINK